MTLIYFYFQEMKLSTRFIFLFLICLLFDLNYCRKSNGNKLEKNVKNQETSKYVASRICKNFCGQGIISQNGEKVHLTENNFKRNKRSSPGESKLKKKKSWLKKLCSCFGITFYLYLFDFHNFLK